MQGGIRVAGLEPGEHVVGQHQAAHLGQQDHHDGAWPGVAGWRWLETALERIETGDRRAQRNAGPAVNESLQVDVHGSDPTLPVRLELQHEFAKAPGVQRIAHFLHQVQVVVQIVDAGEHRAEHFTAAVEVVQVGTAKSA